jgi:hypothetical protein
VLAKKSIQAKKKARLRGRASESVRFLTDRAGSVRNLIIEAIEFGLMIGYRIGRPHPHFLGCLAYFKLYDGRNELSRRHCV